jgi:hypothetical protein
MGRLARLVQPENIPSAREVSLSSRWIPVETQSVETKSFGKTA